MMPLQRTNESGTPGRGEVMDNFRSIGVVTYACMIVAYSALLPNHLE